MVGIVNFKKNVDGVGVLPHTVPMSRARRKQPRQRKTIQLTQRQIQAAFEKQRQAAKERQQRAKAYGARDLYKARKKDRGKFVLVGTQGEKDPQSKGRKGYLIYVTKTGKKWIVKQTGRKGQFVPRKLRDIAPPSKRNFRNAAKNFEAAKLEIVNKGKSAAIKGRGSVSGGSGGYDFSDKVVQKIAKSLKKTIESQRSKRSFLITAMVLVRLGDGTTETIQVQLPIDKADHISIKLGGLINFVRNKFYAFMARELAYHGYVSTGSSNHIRRLPENEGQERDEWVDKLGKPWVGSDLNTVRIISIDWIVQQAK